MPKARVQQFYSKFILFGCFFLISCSSSIDLNHYSIDTLSNAKGNSAQFSTAIAIENFKSPAFLRRQEIIMRSKEEVYVSSSSLWWALPEEMVTEALINYFIQNQTFTHTVPYPTSHNVSYVLEGTVKRFEIYTKDDQWEAKVVLQILLVNRENQIVWDSGLLFASSTSAPEIKAATKAMGKALEKIFASLPLQFKKSIITKVLDEQ